MRADPPKQIEDERVDSEFGEFPNLTVLVIDSQHTRWAADLDDWNAATLLACISEDPANWSELAAVWPRYRVGPSAEFADALPLAVIDPETAVERLSVEECWMVLDFERQRVLSSSAYGDIRRDGCFGIACDDDEEGASGNSGGAAAAEVQMSIHLPPWWEIHNDAVPEQVRRPRETELRRPRSRRDILWGPPLAAALAERMVASFGSSQWKAASASDDSHARYAFTVAVHREWLMTPREDLEGQTPRASLHGGIDWIERVIEGQQWNVSQDRPLTRLPHELQTYREGPMGRGEVCMYFDLCRELIDVGWNWLIEREREDAASAIAASDARVDARVDERVGALARVLEAAQDAWLQSPGEGGGIPAAIIRDERDRIPAVLGEEEQGHLVDCDCPLCLMMAEGLFGPTFLHFDGHHLELDGEFAFSLWEHHDEWEMDQAQYRAMAAEIEREREAATDPPGTLAAAAEEDELLEPVWSGSFVSDELPGDPLGHLKIAFRVTDLVGELQARRAPQADVDRLNQAFIEYRHAGLEQRRLASRRFKAALEQLALLHPSLTSRAADLQSQLDELLRRPTPAV
ncbi:hypothetical protein [Candidatus Laterigemmans baculatus]|uniref:hypothetical protein n=1 Tax=Candidatus Laterigemmans baculatus TaxID=2770505 RepID=UPI0013DAAD84|nr:hypothetical protein [Candidatus Laterigemmans baculatus]